MSALSCCLTPVGGGILHGVCLESGGNGVGLTQHSSSGVGRHAAPHSSADTHLTRIANVSERVEGGGQNTGHKGHPATSNEGKQGKMASQREPEPAYGQDTPKQVDNCSTEVLKPNCILKETATELPASRKSSVNSSPEQEKAGERERGRRDSGEKREREKHLSGASPIAIPPQSRPASIFSFPFTSFASIHSLAYSNTYLVYCSLSTH